MGAAKEEISEKILPCFSDSQLKKRNMWYQAKPRESLYEYWERFNKLCIRYQQHQISEQLLIQYFYEGLQWSNRNIIDAASGRVLANKTPREAWVLIEEMTENFQQFGFRENTLIRRVNEVDVLSIQQ